MQAAQSLFAGLACCSNQKQQLEDQLPPHFLITCFDEKDTELRDVKILPTTTWPQMQECITDAFGAQAIFAYDDGSSVDLPVRNAEEWDRFLEMLKTDRSINGEYDILLLPSGGWARYEKKQREERERKGAEDGVAPAGLNMSSSAGGICVDESAGSDLDTPLDRSEYGDVYGAISDLVDEGFVTSEEEDGIYNLVSISHTGVVRAYRTFSRDGDKAAFGEACKQCIAQAKSGA